jgi:hypothetical protein
VVLNVEDVDDAAGLIDPVDDAIGAAPGAAGRSPAARLPGTDLVLVSGFGDHGHGQHA